MIDGISIIGEMTIEYFERIAEIRKQENPIQYMTGVKLADREVAFHSVYYIDCDIATGDMIGFVEYDGKIEIQRIKRERILHRI